MLDFHNLPADDAKVEAMIDQLNKDECLSTINAWRNIVVSEGLDMDTAQCRAMILLVRRNRALREAPKAAGAKKKAGPVGLSIDEL